MSDPGTTRHTRLCLNDPSKEQGLKSPQWTLTVLLTPPARRLETYEVNKSTSLRCHWSKSQTTVVTTRDRYGVVPTNLRRMGRGRKKKKPDLYTSPPVRPYGFSRTKSVVCLILNLGLTLEKIDTLTPLK